MVLAAAEAEAFEEEEGSIVPPLPMISLDVASPPPFPLKN
jgi:hypothetical protein